jgi:hypothetical protein
MNWKTFGWIIIAVISLIVLTTLGKLVEILPASEEMVIQYPSGKLAAFTEPGFYAQWLGTATHYPKRESYEVENQKIRFNDGGTAMITGNVQFDVPVDPVQLIAMHSKFYNPQTLKAKLVAPAFIKAVNASGPMLNTNAGSSWRITPSPNAWMHGSSEWISGLLLTPPARVQMCLRS